jgi:hypothetical protein
MVMAGFFCGGLIVSQQQKTVFYYSSDGVLGIHEDLTAFNIIHRRYGTDPFASENKETFAKRKEEMLSRLDTVIAESEIKKGRSYIETIDENSRRVFVYLNSQNSSAWPKGIYLIIPTIMLFLGSLMSAFLAIKWK